jgi:uncharacterized protein (AIM24 family)
MITCHGSNDYIFTKAGAFIGGECQGEKNFKFTKVMLGPQNSVGRAILGQLARRVTGENLPLMKVEFSGDSVTYYADRQQHIVVYHLNQGESIYVESENLLAFSNQCEYDVRFLGKGIISQKGLFTSRLTGNGSNAFVAVLVDGNPIVLSNVDNRNTIEVDPDAVVCWVGADPSFKLDVSWRNLIGQHSGESYMFEWNGSNPTTVVIQPNERAHDVHIID